jgi:hypothetical protein
MSGDEATEAVIDALEALAAPYMLVGSFSSNLYGIPRSTEDADIVLQVSEGLWAALAARLGPELRIDPQPSFETVTMTMRNIVNVAGIPFKIELFHLSDDAYDQERFRRRIRMKAPGREVSVPTAEDVVVTKVRWAALAKRSKDIDDARNVIAVQGDRLDWDYIHSWCDRHGSRALLDEIRASIPPI